MARIRYNDGMSESLAERLKAAIAESGMKRSELARAAPHRGVSGIEVRPRQTLDIA